MHKSIYKSMHNIINNIYNVINYKETYRLLGRWCHPILPNCNQNVLLKKIDFANSDNNFCIKKPPNYVIEKMKHPNKSNNN